MHSQFSCWRQYCAIVLGSVAEVCSIRLLKIPSFLKVLCQARKCQYCLHKHLLGQYWSYWVIEYAATGIQIISLLHLLLLPLLLLLLLVTFCLLFSREWVGVQLHLNEDWAGRRREKSQSQLSSHLTALWYDIKDFNFTLYILFELKVVGLKTRLLYA